MTAGSALRPEWVRWIADSLRLGHARADVAARLAEQGVAPDRAAAEVDAVAGSPLLDLWSASVTAAAHDAMVQELRRQTLARGPGRVERRPDLDASAFYATYVAHGVPVVLPGFCASWPARTAWLPDALAARAGDQTVRACVGLSASPGAARDVRPFEQELTLADVARRLAAGEDLYLVANNRNLDGPLAFLLDDLDPPPEFVDRSRLRGAASLWLGHAGTHTPTHHDTSNVLFCQIAGRKTVWLASPSETRLRGTDGTFFACAQLSDAAARAPGGPLEGACVFEVELAPGDALLLPVGWWHEVRALELSVNCSITGLRLSNRFDDFHPGWPASGAR